MAKTTALSPRARPRSVGGNASVMIAKLGAKISAPPKPWRIRATMSCPSEPAAPHHAEPSVNTTRPAIQTGFRPTTSDNRPKLKRLAAMTTR